MENGEAVSSRKSVTSFRFIQNYLAVVNSHSTNGAGDAMRSPKLYEATVIFTSCGKVYTYIYVCVCLLGKTKVANEWRWNLYLDVLPRS